MITRYNFSRSRELQNECNITLSRKHSLFLFKSVLGYTVYVSVVGRREQESTDGLNEY